MAAFQIPGLSFQSLDEARKVALSGDPSRPQSSNHAPFTLQYAAQGATNGVVPTSDSTGEILEAPDTTLTRPASNLTSAVSEDVADVDSEREEGELSDTYEPEAAPLKSVSDDQRIIGPAASASEPLLTDAVGGSKSASFLSQFRPEHAQVLKIISVLLSHGYPRDQLIRDVIGLNKAMLGMNQAPTPASQSNLVSRSTDAVTPSTIPRPSSEIVVDRNPPSQQSMVADKVPEIQQKGPVSQSVPTKPSTRDPDAYKKRLEALKKLSGSKAKTLPVATQVSAVPLVIPADQIPRKKVTLDSARLRERLAALKAQNARLETAVAEPATLAGTSLLSGTQSRFSSPQSSMDGGSGRHPSRNRPTASDLIGADVVASGDDQPQHASPWMQGHRSGNHEYQDEQMIIEASSSESGDDIDDLIKQSAAQARSSIMTEPRSFAKHANGGAGKSEAELRAEIEAMQARIAAREQKWLLSKASTPATETPQLETENLLIPRGARSPSLILSSIAPSRAQSMVPGERVDETLLNDSDQDSSESDAADDMHAKLVGTRSHATSSDSDVSMESSADGESDEDSDDEEPSTIQRPSDFSTSGGLAALAIGNMHDDPSASATPSSHERLAVPVREETDVDDDSVPSSSVQSESESGSDTSSDSDSADMDLDDASTGTDDKSTSGIDQELHAAPTALNHDHDRDEDGSSSDGEYDPDTIMQDGITSDALYPTESHGIHLGEVPRQSLSPNPGRPGVLIRTESGTHDRQSDDKVCISSVELIAVDDGRSLTVVQTSTGIFVDQIRSKNYLMPFESRVRFARDQVMDPMRVIS